jgi:hypothetical protein
MPADILQAAETGCGKLQARMGRLIAFGGAPEWSPGATGHPLPPVSCSWSRLTGFGKSVKVEKLDCDGGETVVRIEVVYEGPLSEWPGPYYASRDQIASWKDANAPLSRRDALLKSISGLLLFPSLSLVYPNQASAQGTISASITSHSVTSTSIQANGIQGAISSLRNDTSNTIDGVVSVDFKTNGVITDQGTEVLRIPRGGFVTARASGDVGGSPGRGSSTGFTGLNSRTATYQVR